MRGTTLGIFSAAMCLAVACSESPGDPGAPGGAAGQSQSSGGSGGGSGAVGAGGSSSGAAGSGGAGGPAAGSGGAAGHAGSGASAGGGAGSGGGSGGTSAGAAGSGGSGGAPVVTSPCPKNGMPCKIMPFGDSITDGFGEAGSYRVELFRRALQAGKSITFVGSSQNGPATVESTPFPPQHEGHSGWTIAPAGGRSGISTLVATVMPAHQPHIVTLMIGTNDAIDDYDMTNAPKRLGQLIDSIYTALPQVLIVVAQIIPSQEDALNARILTYNAAIPGVVQERAALGRAIRLVDMHAVIAANASYKTALLKDTWHPNQAGQTLLGARWYEALADLL